MDIINMDKKEQTKKLVDKWEKLGLLNGLTLNNNIKRINELELLLKYTPIPLKKIMINISKSVIKK